MTRPNALTIAQNKVQQQAGQIKERARIGEARRRTGAEAVPAA
jgi:hypothetical protein